MQSNRISLKVEGVPPEISERYLVRSTETTRLHRFPPHIDIDLYLFLCFSGVQKSAQTLGITVFKVSRIYHLDGAGSNSIIIEVDNR